MIRRRPLTGVLHPRRHEHDEHEHDEHEHDEQRQDGSGHDGAPTSPEHQHARLKNSRAW
ncbi:hypothetical protein NNL26_03240 [Micrococcus luteus]|uniref:hypothetical protein n=1 Tax=Micrococcus luteus TaxID=1270 RepID=UPI00210289A8|nr:hypothetical protein [Micrococcus luteus]UTX35271.1 hypothetical protein NNL26_03240 [Micrococcus luteus]